MDPEYSLQDVVLCHLCETPTPPLHCENCGKHMCNESEKLHLSDQSNEHLVVPIKLRGCFMIFQKHCSEVCEGYCE